MSARTAVLLALILLLPATFRRDLWSPDEPRHAEVARSMLVSGEYVVPHLAGDPYPDKPPPPFWLVAGSMKLFATVEWAARLPFVLAAVGTLALTFPLARLLGMGVAAAGMAVLDRDASRKVESAWPAGTRIIAEQTVGGGEDVIIVRIPKTPGGEWPR